MARACRMPPVGTLPVPGGLHVALIHCCMRSICPKPRRRWRGAGVCTNHDVMDTSRNYQAFRDWLARPSLLELGEYALKTLPPARAAEIARYLANHPEVQRELALIEAELADFEATLPPADTVPPGRMGASGRLILGQRKLPEHSPSLVSVRGAGNDEIQVYAADGIEVTIDIQPDATGAYMLIGSVSEMDYQDLTVSLYQNDTLVVTQGVDDVGDFLIPDLLPAQYVVLLAGPAFTFCIPALRIEP